MRVFNAAFLWAVGEISLYRSGLALGTLGGFWTVKTTLSGHYQVIKV